MIVYLQEIDDERYRARQRIPEVSISNEHNNNLSPAIGRPSYGIEDTVHLSQETIVENPN